MENDIGELEEFIRNLERATDSLSTYKNDFYFQILGTKGEAEEMLEPLKERQQEEWDKEMEEHNNSYKRSVV
jgi:hypothetical protein